MDTLLLRVPSPPKYVRFQIKWKRTIRAIIVYKNTTGYVKTQWPIHRLGGSDALSTLIQILLQHNNF